MDIRSFGKQRVSCWDWYLRGSPHSGSASFIVEHRFLHTFTCHKDSYEAPISLSRLERCPPRYTEGFQLSLSDCSHPVSHVSFTLGKEAHKKIEGVIRSHSLCVVVCLHKSWCLPALSTWTTEAKQEKFKATHSYIERRPSSAL